MIPLVQLVVGILIMAAGFTMIGTPGIFLAGAGGALVGSAIVRMILED